MPGSGDLDSWTSGYQSRDLQRDAPLRLGACATFLAFGLLGLVWSLAGVPISAVWLVPVALAIGIGAAVLATRMSNRKDAIRVAREQAERKIRKDAELAEFVAGNSDKDASKEGGA